MRFLKPESPDATGPQGRGKAQRHEAWRAAAVAALLCGSAAIGWWWGQPQGQQGASPPSASAAQQKPAPKPAPKLPRFASFGAEQPSPDVRHVADWALDSGDAGGRAYAIVDKQQARVWLFDPQGALVAQTPALIGAAVGDDAVPGIGEKPLSEIRPEEKTTPAGRYLAEPGMNTQGEDIVWVSYDLAVSMHRVRANVKAERRLERLASTSPEDNRISFGCINLPVDFYEQVLQPAVRGTGVMVYVLPETRSVQQQFGTYDVSARARGARTAPA